MFCSNSFPHENTKATLFNIVATWLLMPHTSFLIRSSYRIWCAFYRRKDMQWTFIRFKIKVENRTIEIWRKQKENCEHLHIWILLNEYMATSEHMHEKQWNMKEILSAFSCQTKQKRSNGATEAQKKMCVILIYV